LIDEHGKEIASSFFQYQGLTTNCMEDDSILYKNCVQGAACAINRPLKELVLKSLDYINIDNLDGIYPLFKFNKNTLKELLNLDERVAYKYAEFVNNTDENSAANE